MGSVHIDGGETEMVDSFAYLGSSLPRDGDVLSDVNSRIEKDSIAFGSLRGSIFNNSQHVSGYQESDLQGNGLAVLLCGSEVWVLKVQLTRRLNAFTIAV